MILPAQEIEAIRPVLPFHSRTVKNGMTYGLSSAGYDVRIAEGVWLSRDTRFTLASTIEYFNMPSNIVGMVHDKSSWARRGVSLFNTVIEPGWRGYLTLELTYHGDETIRVIEGSPIAQIVFMKLTAPTMMPYEGKYQDQRSGPQAWICDEGDTGI